MISVVVVSFNEGKKLKRCLDSVKDLADEIIVIDLNSTDDTSVVAHQASAKVINHEKVEYVEKVRELAISEAKHPWILILDPDEVVPKHLSDKLKELSDQTTYVAVNIPRKNIFFGKWIAHTNFWPDRQIRFIKKEFTTWPKRIHTYPIIIGEILNLKADPLIALEHYGYDSWDEFYSRQKRYARVEAQNLFKEGKRFNLGNLFWKPMREFLVRFIKHQGYLDGWIGLRLVLGLMWYRVQVEFNLLKIK
jgi:glycosyltransferase involved in cell wall biosynthesis